MRKDEWAALWLLLAIVAIFLIGAACLDSWQYEKSMRLTGCRPGHVMLQGVCVEGYKP